MDPTNLLDPANPLSPLSPVNPANPLNPLNPLNPQSLNYLGTGGTMPVRQAVLFMLAAIVVTAAVVASCAYAALAGLRRTERRHAAQRSAWMSGLDRGGKSERTPR